MKEMKTEDGNPIYCEQCGESEAAIEHSHANLCWDCHKKYPEQDIAMKLVIELYLDTKDWKPTTAQIQTILRRTANRLTQKLPCLGLAQDICNDNETIIGKWGIYETS